MPITIAVPQPADTVGSGAQVFWLSDFVGPLETGTQFQVDFASDAEFTAVFESWIINTDSTFGQIRVGGRATSSLILTENEFIHMGEGDSTHIQVQLLGPTGTVLDSGVATKAWSNEYLDKHVVEWRAADSSGGLTTDQATQLSTIEDAVKATIEGVSSTVTYTLGQLFSRKTLDLITLEEITSGPTSAPVRTTLSTFYYGVIIRLTTIPDNLIGTTPDGEWYYPDLAVLRIRRGADLQFRKGIHTTEWMELHPWRYGADYLNAISPFFVPPETEVMVDFMFGVEGQVYLMLLP